MFLPTFLIYYGWIPTAPVEKCQFDRVLSSMQCVVLGAGLAIPQHPNYVTARGFIQSHPIIHFYGYISVGMSLDQPRHNMQEIVQSARQWYKLGAQGILLDCAGPDYGVTPFRLRSCVHALHQEGLHVIVNAWNPHACLAVGLTPEDGYLEENWTAHHRPKDYYYAKTLAQQGIQIYAVIDYTYHTQAFFVDAMWRGYSYANYLAYTAHNAGCTPITPN